MQTCDRIKTLLDANGDRAADLARALKVSRSAVSAILSGKHQPSKQNCALICDRYGVSIEWLHSGTGEPQIRRAKKEELSSLSEKLFGSQIPEIAREIIELLPRMSEPQMRDLLALMQEVSTSV